MPRSQTRLGPLPPIALALVMGAAGASLAAACGSSSTDTTTMNDGGDEGGCSLQEQAAHCPQTEPDDDIKCCVPEGTTCDFGQCGTRVSVCTGGFWRTAGNAAPNPPCPADPPSAAVLCPACWPTTKTCKYGSTDCSLADASVNTAVASCLGGAWVLDIQPCRDGGEPDVQGDAGPDAD